MSTIIPTRFTTRDSRWTSLALFVSLSGLLSPWHTILTFASERRSHCAGRRYDNSYVVSDGFMSRSPLLVSRAWSFVLSRSFANVLVGTIGQVSLSYSRSSDFFHCSTLFHFMAWNKPSARWVGLGLPLEGWCISWGLSYMRLVGTPQVKGIIGLTLYSMKGTASRAVLARSFRYVGQLASDLPYVNSLGPGSALERNSRKLGLSLWSYHERRKAMRNPFLTGCGDVKSLMLHQHRCSGAPPNISIRSWQSSDPIWTIINSSEVMIGSMVRLNDCLRLLGGIDVSYSKA